nr:MAG TPA: Regulator of erythroid cell expansion [Caudoviricetes sp.]
MSFFTQFCILIFLNLLFHHHIPPIMSYKNDPEDP